MTQRSPSTCQPAAHLLGGLPLDEARQRAAGEVDQGLHGQGVRRAGQLAQAPRVQPDELLIKDLALLQRQRTLMTLASHLSPSESRSISACSGKLTAPVPARQQGCMHPRLVDDPMHDRPLVNLFTGVVQRKCSVRPPQTVGQGVVVAAGLLNALTSARSSASASPCQTFQRLCGICSRSGGAPGSQA